MSLPVDSVYDPFSPVQLIGYVAFTLGILAVLQRSDIRMKILMVSMTGFIVTHFVLLGSMSAAVGSLIAGTRTGLSIFNILRRRALHFSAFFMVLTLGFGIVTYAKPLDVLPVIAVLIGHYAFFNFQGLRLRAVLVLISTIWLAHNILAYSYGPAMMEGLIILANLSTMYRIRALETKQAAFSA